MNRKTAMEFAGLLFAMSVGRPSASQVLGCFARNMRKKKYCNVIPTTMLTTRIAPMIELMLIPSNENKMSDGGGDRASIGGGVWKSSQSGAHSGPPFAPSH